MKAVGYVRTSSRNQNIGNQRWNLERWAKDNDVELVAVHEDFGVSGFDPPPTRRGFMAAVKDLEKHRCDSLLVMYNDRLARSAVGWEAANDMVQGLGAHVIVAHPPSFEEQANSMAALAKFIRAEKAWVLQILAVDCHGTCPACGRSNPERSPVV